MLAYANVHIKLISLLLQENTHCSRGHEGARKMNLFLPSAEHVIELNRRIIKATGGLQELCNGCTGIYLQEYNLNTCTRLYYPILNIVRRVDIIAFLKFYPSHMLLGCSCMLMGDVL